MYTPERTERIDRAEIVPEEVNEESGVVVRIVGKLEAGMARRREGDGWGVGRRTRGRVGEGRERRRGAEEG